jgi:arabinofuranosyltransferase
MLLPALFLVLLPILVVPRSKSLGVVTMVIGLWAALSASFLRYPAPDGSFRPIDDERAYYAAWTGRPNPTDSGDYVPKLQGLQDAVRAASGQRSLIYQGVDNRILTTPLRAGVPEQMMVVGAYLGTAGMLAPEQMEIVDFWGLSNPLSNAWLLADYADPAAPVQPRAISRSRTT